MLRGGSNIRRVAIGRPGEVVGTTRRPDRPPSPSGRAVAGLPAGAGRGEHERCQRPARSTYFEETWKQATVVLRRLVVVGSARAATARCTGLLNGDPGEDEGVSGLGITSRDNVLTRLARQAVSNGIGRRRRPGGSEERERPQTAITNKSLCTGGLPCGWHRYQYTAPTTEIARLLKEIDRDPTGPLGKTSAYRAFARTLHRPQHQLCASPSVKWRTSAATSRFGR